MSSGFKAAIHTELDSPAALTENHIRTDAARQHDGVQAGVRVATTIKRNRPRR